MTSPAAQAVRDVLGPYASETKCEAVVRAVLMAVRQTDVRLPYGDNEAHHMNFRAQIDALLREGVEG